MKSKSRLYCRLCWQQFDHPAQHDAGSMLLTLTGNQRLNGHCPGDIHPVAASAPAVERAVAQPGPFLKFSGEPIELK
jgi:hypothetical protein